MMKANCIDCGSEFNGKTKAAKLCDGCRVKRQRESSKAWKKRNPSKVKYQCIPPYIQIKCECGHLFEAGSKRAKYCERCKLDKKRKRVRDWKRRNKTDEI